MGSALRNLKKSYLDQKLSNIIGDFRKLTEKKTDTSTTWLSELMLVIEMMRAFYLIGILVVKGPVS